jgi:competence protein ComEA
MWKNKNNLIYLLCIAILLLAVIIEGYLLFNNEKKSINFVSEEELLVDNPIEEVDESEKNIEESIIYQVDIKGAVKKPGVYEVSSDSIINDVISLAGGLKTNAYTDNINLSKKVINESVIYVYNKNEIKENNNSKTTQVCKENNTYQINDCLDNGSSIIINNEEYPKDKIIEPSDNNIELNSTEVDEKKVNINSASKEQLMQISGIGESKADAIIAYRENNGLFAKLEDIMNVSGIGQALYDKIKDFITV